MTIYLEKWTEDSKIKDWKHNIKGNEDMITFRVLYIKKILQRVFLFPASQLVNNEIIINYKSLAMA